MLATQATGKSIYTTHKCRKVSTVSNDVPYLLEFVAPISCALFGFALGLPFKQSLILLILDQFELIYGPFKEA